ncbi:flagellar hook-associated protein FlgK [Kineococcus rhizosphaerae]|uniref:Flagellar hook-associated protein 1 n=1 Tax=Kineococcus rhizosphaerae TaxID=559628 RepID=A0A2T0RAR9_9ACTN|nr:flagellar hook-associated protein FlgK [Kineococcus rhizosphaerae]PRY18254.1 flagellar hook-associated protein 1 FlgK [Kineococcus rhizosphaerae]
MSTFSGINTARRGLSAAQLGMDVTGQNVANANTDGYSRQRVEQSASVLSQSGPNALKNTPGDGVVVTSISRVSDALATATARQDSAAAMEQAAASNVWGTIESAIGDTGATGLSQALQDLGSAWNTLANNNGTTGQDGNRQLVLTRSQAVVSTIGSMNGQLEAQYDQLGLQAQAQATQANTAAANIAKLNTSIRETLSTGASANELMDQRDQYLNQLSDLTGSRVVNRDNGTVDVFVGNATIVTGDYSYTMTLSVPDPSNPGQTIGNPRIGDQVVASINGQDAAPVAGSLKGTLDGANKTLADQKSKLDDFAATLADKVNTATGTSFFAAAGGGTVDSGNITLAATSVQDSTNATGDGSTDRAFAKEVVKQFGAVKQNWLTNVTNLASSAQSASNRADLASQVSLKSASVRDSVSGVNLDEEMTNLVAYQHAYSAAAKVLTTMDEALDTLMNMVR